MSSVLLFIGILVVAAIVAVLIIASTKPDTFRVQRSAAIAAPPEAIFPYLDDFRRWTAWSPYEHRDPAMKRTFSGPATGKGSIYEWDGNKNVGKGRIEVTEVSPNARLAIDLDMLKPFEAHNKAEFTLLPQGDATLVTWAMHGPAPFFSKVMQVFCNMDRMVGADFEAGLAKLKAISETR
jgi:uncharacterized protein YndB with AHSA1/START domain